jgi:hypothetical protein
VIVPCDLEGKTRKEAARLLGWAEGTVASRLVRGRGLLAKRLAHHGLALSGGALAAALSPNVVSAGMRPGLVISTVKAATLFAANQVTATGVLSARVVALTEGVLRSMFLSKLKVTAVFSLALGVAGAGLGMFGYPALAARPTETQVEGANQPDTPKGQKPDAVSQTQESGVIKALDPGQRTMTILQYQTRIPSTPILTPTFEETLYDQRRLIGLHRPQAEILLNQPSAGDFYRRRTHNELLIALHRTTQLEPLLSTCTSVNERKLRLAPRVTVLIDGKVAKLSELAPETPVHVTEQDGLVTLVVATGITMEACHVQGVDFRKHVLNVRHYTGNVFQYDLAKDVQIMVDGNKGTLAELTADTPVSLQFSAVNPKRVIGIQAAGPTVACVVRAVDARRHTVTILLPREHLIVPALRVAEDAPIEIDGKAARFADVKPGMRASLHMAADPEKSLVLSITIDAGKKH